MTLLRDSVSGCNGFWPAARLNNHPVRPLRSCLLSGQELKHIIEEEESAHLSVSRLCKPSRVVPCGTSPPYTTKSAVRKTLACKRLPVCARTHCSTCPYACTAGGLPFLLPGSCWRFLARYRVPLLFRERVHLMQGCGGSGISHGALHTALRTVFRPFVQQRVRLPIQAVCRLSNIFRACALNN